MAQQTQHIDLHRLLRTLRTRDLTTEEWVQLDSYAGEDPLLQEALEGLKQLPAETRQAHLRSIVSKLAGKQKQKKKTIGIPVWMATAASVLLIVTIWGISRIDWTDRSQVAQQTSSNDDTLIETEIIVSNAESDNEEGLSFPPESTPMNQEKKETPASRAQPLVTPASKSSETTNEISASDDRGHQTPASDPQDQPAQSGALSRMSRQASDEAGESEMIDSPAAKEDLSMDAAGGMRPEVRGIVMNNLGEPMRGVPVQLKGTQVQTQTDYLGNFTVDIPHPGNQNALVITPAGYAPVETDIVEGDSLVIRLLEGAPSGQAEITTLAQKSSAKASRPAGRAFAMPRIGERSYNKYLRLNLRYPSQASRTGIHGTVIVEFDLTPDGTPSGFRILKSLGYGCDEEAIRLIREGPKWEITQVPVGRWEVEF